MDRRRRVPGGRQHGLMHDHGLVHNHEPSSYLCPFCRNVDEGGSDFPLEVLHRDTDVFVKLNPRWHPGNPGSALVIPVAHHENVFDLPVELATPIHRAVRSTALALKAAMRCDGVSTRQHNEPAGDQEVWHYHVHVIPRFAGDDLARSARAVADPTDMREVAERLRHAWPKESGATRHFRG